MTRASVTTMVLLVGVGIVRAQTASAQAPAPKLWTMTASAGLALTSGNTDTSTVNAGYDIVYDPDTRNVVKSDGLLIRGKTQGVLSTSRLGLNVRDEFALSARTVVYGQNQYLQDEFKNIDYLLAPTAGLGYKILDTAETKLNVDGGAGGVWEKNLGVGVTSSGAVTAGEKFSTSLTPTTTLTHSFAALWKTNDFDDAPYTVGVGIAASMSSRTQLKVELIETYKNKPPAVTVQKSDIAVLMAIVFKM